MAASTAWTEGETAVMDAADVLVRITKKESIPPQPRRYANINVWTKKSNGSEIKGEVLDCAGVTSKNGQLTDKEELNFVGKVKLWNCQTLTQETVNEMKAYGETLVVTSSCTASVHPNGNGAISNLDFGNMIIWLTEAASTATLDAWVKLPNHGAFVDGEKKGKVLYTLSRLLDNPEELQYSTQIQNGTFKGITALTTANTLDDAGYSYYFKANDLCWPRGFWIGGHQARSVYADRSVIYDVKQVVARLVQSGLEFNDGSMALLEARILQALKLNPFVVQIHSINIPYQKPSNKVRGIIAGVKVKYETAQEVRTVFIELGGEE